jgi:S-adenosylmethionine synthetase
MSKASVFVSESVTRGHPDKLCDQISDAIVDRFLAQDGFARVDAECAVATGIVFLAARYHADEEVDITRAARDVIEDIGYDRREFDPDRCTVLSTLTRSDAPRRDAAGPGTPADAPVTVLGFACSQTESLMPLPLDLAHGLARQLDEVRMAGTLDFLSPDCKTQAAVEIHNGRPGRIHALALVLTGDAGRAPDSRTLRRLLKKEVVDPVLAARELEMDRRSDLFIQPDGALATGGPTLHAGLTGRKTGMDTYGEYARHGGAALSGKDPSRIDRLGAYAARYLAKNAVAAGLAESCEIQISWTSGRAEPVSLWVDTFGTGALPDDELIARLEKAIDLRPAGLLKHFGLGEPQPAAQAFFRRLAVYGHMGREDLDLPWERRDLAAQLG